MGSMKENADHTQPSLMENISQQDTNNKQILSGKRQTSKSRGQGLPLPPSSNAHACEQNQQTKTCNALSNYGLNY